MKLLIAVPFYIVYVLLNRGSGGIQKKLLSVLRKRYPRGELSNDEFDRRLEWTPGLGLPLE